MNRQTARIVERGSIGPSDVRQRELGAHRLYPSLALREGFTLIELLVVLTILAISLSFMAPKLVGIERAELKGSARKLLYTIRRLSDEALFKKERRVLKLDLDKREYWGDGGNKSQLPGGVFVESVVIGTEEFNRGVVSITCFPSGLRDEAWIRLSRKGQKGYTVVIPALGERFEVREE